jgi:DoxX-like family
MSIARPPVRRPGMEATLNRPAEPRARAETIRIWSARILGALVTVFLLVDGAGKVLRLAPYVEGTAKVGYPATCLVPLGMVLVASTILYAIPRTAVLGAVLLTGYLGGATATHVRMGQPFYFPVVFGALVWACLYLRDDRVRALLPFDRRPNERNDARGR